jgi:hypothetical protein
MLVYCELYSLLHYNEMFIGIDSTLPFIHEGWLHYFIFFTHISQYFSITTISDPQPVSNDGLKFMLEGVVKNSGLEKKHENVNGKVSQRTEIMAAHGLRKFFDTNLSRARLQRNKLEALGHKSLQRLYDKPDNEELLEEYLKAVELLTINDENRLKAKVATLEDKDKQIQELTKTVEEMQSQVVQSTEEQEKKDRELEELKNKVHQMYDIIQNLMTK